VGSKGKPSGINSARKLRRLHRKALWARKDFKKKMLGSDVKAPMAGASHAKGIVVEKM
jgi:small subunit ribosomal protein S23e